MSDAMSNAVRLTFTSKEDLIEYLKDHVQVSIFYDMTGEGGQYEAAASIFGVELAEATVTEPSDYEK